MKLARLIAALAVLWAGSAHAQTVFPTPNANVNAPGEVVMCATQAGPLSGTPFPPYVPCTAPGALPLPVAVQSNPAQALLQPPSIVTAAATGTTGAVTATLTAPGNGKTLYICGFDASAIGGTADIGPITVTGLTGGNTFTYHIASSAGGVTLNRLYTPCIPAVNANTNIAVATTADGTATAVDVNVWGVAQ